MVVVAPRIPGGVPEWDTPERWLLHDGTLAGALPVGEPEVSLATFDEFGVGDDAVEASERFGVGAKATPFRAGGVMWRGHVWTAAVVPVWDGARRVLRDMVHPEEQVDDRFYIPDDEIGMCGYLKNAKREQRIHTAPPEPPIWDAEDAIAYRDPLDRPSRTILTGEGGSGPSRFKHVIRTESGRLRRLTPLELERLNGFPDDWTNVRMSDGRWISDARRAFLMGTALVVGVVRLIGASLAERNLVGTTPVPAAAAS